MARPNHIAVSLLATLSLALAASAQTRPPSGYPPSGGSSTPASRGLPIAEIEKLVAPIALYPDVLIAQILPASTFPTDVVMAARWLRTKPDMKTLTDQKWDPSVLALCKYPDVLYMLDKDLDWTNALGAAFLDHQKELMDAIQLLRAQAQAAGVLATNDQQVVVQEGASILIVPPTPQTVYVPQYNPQVIYVDDDDDDDGVSVATAATASAISFGAGVALGAWLDMDCNWGSCCVNYCRPGYWGGYYGRYGATAVAWGNSWAAAVGPRRAGFVGPNGGAYVGPRGGAVWHNGRGAAWARPTPYGRPAYTGRYSSYGRYASNRSNIVAGNNVNVNRNNVNIDRGNRNYQGGNRTNIGAGNRPNYPGAGQTPGAGRPGTPGGGQNPGARPTPYGGNTANRAGQQGQWSGQRQQGQNRYGGGYGSGSSSAFGSSRYGSQANRYSNRGYSSRGYSGGGSSGRSYGGGGRSYGGGGRRGGGGGRRR